MLHITSLWLLARQTPLSFDLRNEVLFNEEAGRSRRIRHLNHFLWYYLHWLRLFAVGRRMTDAFFFLFDHRALTKCCLWDYCNPLLLTRLFSRVPLAMQPSSALLSTW